MNYRFERLSRCLTAFFFSCCWFFATAQEPAAVFPDSLPNPDSLSEEALQMWAGRLSAHAKSFGLELDNKAGAATAAVEAAVEALNSARQDSLSAKSSLDSLSDLVKKAKKIEKDALKQQKQGVKTVEFAGKVEVMDAAGQRKNLPRCYKQVKEIYLLLYPPPPVEKPVADIIGAVGVVAPDTLSPAPPQTAPEAAADKKKTREKTGPKFKPYDPAEDVMLHPPQRPCALAANTRDEFSGETYKETQREEIFRFTNDLMKKYLAPDQPHIVCEAALSSGSSVISLHLTFGIRDNNARKTFGSLARNSVVILKFIDGTTFTASNLRNDDGALDPAAQVFTYRGQYALDPSILKKLRKTELDKIRVSWSTGYEDYEVQNVDLLMRQTKCLFD